MNGALVSRITEGLRPTPARGPEVASRVGIALGTAILICFLTGLLSHWIQHPPSWFWWPAHPVWLYRVTQGAHVIFGVAAIPLLLVKLWAVYPRLFQRPIIGSPLRLLERGSIAILVGATIFQLSTGLLNTAQYYPWKFFFPTAHYAMAYVAVGALAVHLAVKLPVIRDALQRPLAGPDISAQSQARPGVGSGAQRNAPPAGSGAESGTEPQIRPHAQGRTEPKFDPQAQAGNRAGPGIGPGARGEARPDVSSRAHGGTEPNFNTRPQRETEPNVNTRPQRATEIEIDNRGQGEIAPALIAQSEVHPVARHTESTGASTERRAAKADVRPHVSRRTVLTGAGIAATVAGLSVAGQTIPFLRWAAVLAPRSGHGPQGLPVNRSAVAAGVGDLARDPAYRLTMLVGDQKHQFTRADLLSLPQTHASLPIACVEGWSAGADWSGVRLLDLLAAVGEYPGGDVRFRSLERTGIYGSSVLPQRHAVDRSTLIALTLNGETLDLDHGYPCRLIAPNRPGVLQTKWLSEIEVLP